MFKEIFLFELRTGFKKLSTYIYFLIFFTLTLLLGLAISGAFDTASTDANIVANSSYAVSGILVGLSGNIMVLVNGVIIIALMATSIQKDYAYNTHSLLYTKPIQKFGYFWGRFLGSFLLTVFVFSGLLIGYYFGTLYGKGDPIMGPFLIQNYLWPFLIFTIPNVFILGSIFFAITTITRNTLAAYLLCIVLLVIDILVSTITADLDNKTLASLIDPFGNAALGNLTQYWTPFEQNTILVPLKGNLLWNRLLWISISFIIVSSTYFKFQFSQFGQPFRLFKRKTKSKEEAAVSINNLSMAQILNVPKDFSFGAKVRELFYLSFFEFKKVILTTFFLIIAFLAILMIGISSQYINSIYDSEAYPTTFVLMELINEIMSFFLLILIVFYAGNIIWRDKDMKMDELLGATPVSNFNLLFSKFLGLTWMTISLLLIGNITGIFIQAYQSYFNFEPLLYLKYDLYILPYFLIVIGFCLFVQVLVSNKYFGFFLSLVPILFLHIIFSQLEWEDNLFRFNSSGPTLPYSAMNGFGHTLFSYVIFKSYWLAKVLFLCVIGLILYPRGKEKSIKSRIRLSKTSFKGKHKIALVSFALLATCLGGFIYYNTHVLNTYYTGIDRERMQADYEKKYKYLANIPQPKIISSNIKVDLFPSEQGMNVKGFYFIKNKTQNPIDTLVINLPENIDTYYNYKELKISTNSAIIADDNDLGLKVYQLSDPIQPGDSIRLDFAFHYAPRGFKNSGTETGIVNNGTFFNNTMFPGLGYNEYMELSENEARKKYGLKDKPRMAKVDDLQARMNTYISSDADWIQFEAEISTEENQIAIAPGYLQKEWTENGRRNFIYKMDSPILNFYAFMSAEYQVKKDKWNDVNIEIYYQKGHEFNVDRMINSVKKSLDYFTKNFSPYQHRQVRIIEFPRYASFAQAFPNTIPYSEDIGFLTRVDSEDNSKIDVPFYVTAHEVAHQWWAHQVIGGNVQGSVLMSETMSQYSALMVMEKEYGPHLMKKFLRYEMDRYLRGRTSETKEEMPLMLNENQDYIHYRKGSVIMYALKDYLGENNLNQILSGYIDKTAFQEPPYTNSIEFVDAVKQGTPDSLQYLIKDMFEDITVYENYVKDLSYKEMKDNRYEVTLTVGSAKFKSDGIGKSKRVPVADYIDIGVFGEKSKKAAEEDKVLVFKKVKMDKPEKTFTFMVNEEPKLAGIDPYNKLIDRNPENNTHDFKSKPEKVSLDEDEKGIQGIRVQIGD